MMVDDENSALVQRATYFTKPFYSSLFTHVTITKYKRLGQLFIATLSTYIAVCAFSTHEGDKE